jgi:flagellar protein FlaI
MEVLNRFRKKDQDIKIKVDKGVDILEAKPEYEVITEYFIEEPNSKIKILYSPDLGEGLHYYVEEAPLSPEQYETYEKIVRILSKEFESPTEEHVDPKDYVFEQAEIIAEKYHRSLGKFTMEQWDQVFYYVVRDLIGYGPLQGIMGDPDIEDISCNGIDMPVYVWHRRYESIPTNITFTSEQALNDFLVKMAHRGSKHISSAQPLLDAMLPEKHRLAATFMKEVSMKGSTFCIRKFRSEPYSIVDLIKIGTISERIAAYFWLILEHKKSFMIVGGTGSGKTTMLNSLLSLMSQNDKIVTVEEVPELSPPVANWTQLQSRESFNFGDGPSGNISLFDLIKVSLRYRPDYVIVGEIRGEEAYVLFQALATGHGGLCTMHADSIDRVVKRLTSPPMNVSEVYIPLMNIALYIQRVELPGKKDGINFGRRVRTVSEIAEFDNYIEVARWDPRKDVFSTWFKDSFILQQISATSGRPMDELLEEIDKREQYIHNIVESGVRAQRDVAEKVLFYNERQREEKEEAKPAVKPEVQAVINEESSKEVIELLKDASSSFLKELAPEEEPKLIATPKEKAAPKKKEVQPNLEFTHDMLGFLQQTFAEKDAKAQPEPEGDESELDLATKVLWQLADEATKLLVKEKAPLDSLTDTEAEEVKEA